MTRRILLSLAMISPLALSHPVMAYDFMSINFSGDAAGAAPSTNSTPAGPVSKPSAIGGYDADSDPEGFGDSPPKADEGTVIVNDAGTMSKAAVLTTFTANNQQGAMWMDTDYGVTSDKFRLSFDIDIAHTVSNSTVQTYALDGPLGPQTEMIFGLNEFSPIGSVLGFAAAPLTSTTGVFAFRDPTNTQLISFFNYTVGDTYHVDIDGDYSTHTLDAYVDGTLEVSNSPMRAGSTSDNLVETFAFVNGDSVGSNSVALDNLTLSVPEPTSLSLLAVGGLAMLRRRRRA